MVHEKKAPDQVEKLFVDCFGNIQLVSKYYSYQLFYNYNEIVFLDKTPIKEFYSKLQPCQCVFRNYVYFKEVLTKKIKNRYFYISAYNKSDRKIINEIVDKEKLQMFNLDYDIRYFLKQRRAGNGCNSPVSVLTEHLDELRENVTLTNNYTFLLGETQSEMIKRDSCLLIVDYTNKLIYKHNFLGGLLDKDTLMLKNLTPKAVIDSDRKKYYFVREKNGITTLFKNNNETGKLVLGEFKFVQNLRCKNGVFYFLYRDPLINATRKIYVYRN